MRLIDADNLINIIDGLAMPSRHEMLIKILQSIINVVNEMATVDAEPVRHGKWQSMNERNEIYGDVYMCDNCGHGFIICENFHYCPKCGAKMDGE